jgi:outer membrane protein
MPLLKFNIRRAGLVSFLLVLLSGCVSLSRSTSPSPETAWTPPPSVEKQPVPLPVPEIPPELARTRQSWTLSNLLDIGLRNNTGARAAWQAARAAAASLGVAESVLFPSLSFDLMGTKTMGSAVGGRFTFDFSSLAPTVSLSYTIFDFGLAAGLKSAREALVAANFSQNAALQAAILGIERDYYLYLAVRALLAAQETAVKEARANLDAAEARHSAGVATILEVLQARTALSNARLSLISTQGQIQNQKGALATSMGLPANTAYEVVDEMPSSLPLDRVKGEVDRFIDESQARRPDLAAARAQVREARAQVGFVRSEGLPTLSVNGNVGRTYYNIGSPSNSYSVSVVLDVPLFRGFQVYYRLLQAKAEAEAALTRMNQLEHEIILQVWTSYYSLATAAQRVRTAEDLVASAEQSYEGTLVSYKRGVNSILDLLTAENSLAAGRAQLIQAKSDWLQSLVQFEYDVGRLSPAAGPAPQGEHQP